MVAASPGQVTQVWARTFPPAPAAGLSDWGMDTISTGLYTFVAGTTEVTPGQYFMFVNRYDSLGTLEQTAYFPSASFGAPANRAVKKMAYHLGGGSGPSYLAITGEIPGLGGSRDIVTVVYDTPEENLTQRWDSVFTNAQCDNAIPLDDVPVDVAFLGKNFVGVAGVSAGCGTGTDFITLVYNVSDGAPVVERRYSSPGDALDYPVGVRFAGDRVITAGTVQLATGRAIAAVAYDVITSPGTQIWTMNYPFAGRHLDAKGMESSPDGLGFYIAATSAPFTPGGTNADVHLFKFNFSDGLPAWTPNYTTYNGDGNGDDGAVAVDALRWKPMFIPFEDHVYVAGYTTRPGFSGTDKDVLLLAFQDVGSSFVSLAEARDDGQIGQGNAGGDDRAIALDVANNPGIDGSRAIVTAQAMNLAGGFDFMTLKYTSQGVSSALRRIYYPLGLSAAADLPAAVSAPNAQDWFVTGRTFNPTSLDDCVTIRYFDQSP
ncbi:MAG: hypothetical protein IT437_04855 [Phycisphaerales bacterium]|nr:hypothetical protein [Phycisphaerales bacterium]